MASYGYARVSPGEQDLTSQREALLKAGCSIVHGDLELLLGLMRKGDTLMVTRIDRLARSMKDLQDIVHGLKAKGIALKATEQPVDTIADGKAFLDALGVFAEFGTNIRRERQAEGAAKSKNRA